MGSGAENIYPLPPPVLLPLGEAAPRTPGAGPGRPRGGGHSAGPGPSARARQLWGAACDPCPRVWGRAEGPRREERLQTLRGGEEGGGGGAVLQLTPGRSQPHGPGGAWSGGTGGQGPALPHGCPAPPGPARHGPGGDPPRRKNFSPPSLGEPLPGGGCWGRERGAGAHSEQGEGKGTTRPRHPPPQIWRYTLNKARRNTSVCSKYFNKDSFRHRYTYKRSYIAVII